MKQKVFIISAFLLALVMLNIVYADKYCFLKLGDKESIHSSVNSISKHLICAAGKCTCNLISGEGFCRVCTNSSGWYASYTKCEDLCPEINPSEQSLTLTTNWPFSDKGVYTKQNFIIDISTNKIASIYLIDNIAGTQKTLCPNCKEYRKSMTFKQGFNDITIRAVNGNEVVEKTITFIIDNKKPIISKTLPLSGKFAKSGFSVVYSEDFVKEVLFVYGNSDIGFRQRDLGSCPSGKLQMCMASVDLSDYDGKDIYYRFNITDIAGNKASSRLTKVKVDLIPPIVNNEDIFSKTAGRTGSSVTFKLNVTESNMDKVYYTDNGENEKILCSVLSKGICNKKLIFRVGEHSIYLFVRDKAGNQVTLGPYAFTI